MANCVPCRWCGRPILWVNAPTGRIPVENELTPYKRRSDGRGVVLYTAEGARIACDILPDERESERNGYAHRYHFCTKKPADYKPMSKREREREEYKAWRAEKAE